MAWLIAYIIFHVLCAIGAYGAFYHGMYSLHVRLQEEFRLPPEDYKETHTDKVVAIFMSLIGGPMSLAVWSFQNWRRGFGLGFKFNV
ncbi:MAG: hypothetical protein HYW88_00975 [Candidatus Sungbacteria bacterium]|nr:hypothetical protein [Candidatus Sungbacteria bacterium]